MPLAPRFLLLALAALPALPVAGPQDETPPSAVAAASPEARARWERLIAASRPEAEEAEPIDAFLLRADVRFRGEAARRNDATVDYRYLAPGFIRARLASERETGRGPGRGQGAYWLRDGEEVVRLIGREYGEDRRQVDEMLVVARNFIALSDPARLHLTKLELLPGPPSGLPRLLRRISRKKVDWIRVASPDFALVQDQLKPGAGPRPSFEVELGISRANDLPVLALIREVGPPPEEDPPRPAPPLLIHLEDWRPQDGFRIPWKIRVYRRDPSPETRAFEELPGQDIVLLEANLRPHLVEADFAPK